MSGRYVAGKEHARIRQFGYGPINGRFGFAIESHLTAVPWDCFWPSGSSGSRQWPGESRSPSRVWRCLKESMPRMKRRWHFSDTCCSARAGCPECAQLVLRIFRRLLGWEAPRACTLSESLSEGRRTFRSPECASLGQIILSLLLARAGR